MTKYITVPAPESMKDFFDLFLSNNKGFIAGGALRSVFEETLDSMDRDAEKPSDLLEKVGSKANYHEMKDIDVFFESEKDFKDAHSSFVNSDKTEILYETRNSIGLTISWNSPVTDLVRKSFLSVEETLESFDLTVTQCALYRDDNGVYHLMMSEEFLNDVFYHRLNLSDNARKKDSNVENIMERTVRYMRYGYHPNDQSALEVVQSFVNSHAELAPLCDNPDLKKELFGQSIASSKGLRSIYNGIISRSGSDEGSFSAGYRVERECIREIIQKVTEPDFKGAPYFKYFKEKYNLGYFIQPQRIRLTTVNMLKFLESKESVIGSDALYRLIHLMFLYNFTVDSPTKGVMCNHCCNYFEKCSYAKYLMSNDESMLVAGHSRSLNEGQIETIHIDPFSENAIEVMYKAFTMNDDDQWVKDTAEFFIEYASSINEVRMSLKKWHEFLEGELFDPTLPPVLVVSLGSE